MKNLNDINTLVIVSWQAETNKSGFKDIKENDNISENIMAYAF